ncbi:MAG: ribosome recycling factor [Firmicutes bacterium]|nr:ribosome recycling factor [Bacillota bacterium]
MLESLYSEMETKMKKTIEALKREFATLRAGRATPSLLDKVDVDYYGTKTPLKQLANISAPEPRLLVVQPWDKGAIADIEKAILKSDLGLTPNNDGNIIRISIPQLTEERRKELVKFVRKKTEEGRVAIRNQRRDANEQLKALEKGGKISEDDLRRAQEEVQKITDQNIKVLEEVLAEKEMEIMEV